MRPNWISLATISWACSASRTYWPLWPHQRSGGGPNCFRINFRTLLLMLCLWNSLHVFVFVQCFFVKIIYRKRYYKWNTKNKRWSLWADKLDINPQLQNMYVNYSTIQYTHLMCTNSLLVLHVTIKVMRTNPVYTHTCKNRFKISGYSSCAYMYMYTY